MSRTVTTTRRCDRCSATEVEDEVGGLEGWGRAAARRNAGDAPGGFGLVSQPDDLCPACITDLLAWFAEPRVAAAPPAPSAPPPPPPPVFTLDDRRVAIGLVERGLRQRVTWAFEALKEEPTSILSGEIVPGAFFGIDETAAGIVDGVLDQLGFSHGGTPIKPARGGGRKAPPLTDFDAPAVPTADVSAPVGRSSKPALAAAKPEPTSP